jgi:hypothetical protein
MMTLGLVFPIFKIISDKNFINILESFFNNYNFLYFLKSFSREDLLAVFLIFFLFFFIL